MPGPDALQNLLINKYGVSPADAEAYAYQITSGGQAGGHEGALKEEALTNVATNELGTMRNLGKFPQAVQAAQGGNAMGLSAQDLDFAIGLLDQSSQNTANKAQAAGQARESLRGKAQENLAGEIANREVDRMGDFAAGYPKPGGESTSTFVYPGAQPPPPDPYEQKLQRAMALRKAALGF